MRRKKHIMLGLAIFTMIILVLSGCDGGGGNGGGGGSDDPEIYDFNAASFEGTTWKCVASGDRPEITVKILKIIESKTVPGYACFTGSVECDATGKINIDAAESTKIIWLLGIKEYGTNYISFHVWATSALGDIIQVDGTMISSNMNEISVHYLKIKAGTLDYNNDSETVRFTKV